MPSTIGGRRRAGQGTSGRCFSSSWTCETTRKTLVLCSWQGRANRILQWHSTRPGRGPVEASEALFFVETLENDFAAVNSRPVHPFFKQCLVNIGNQITVGVGVGRWCSIRAIWMDVLRTLETAGNCDIKRRLAITARVVRNGRLTSSHGITVCKASASLVFQTRKIAYEGDGTLFIQIPVATAV